jgi:hypothetical protein
LVAPGRSQASATAGEDGFGSDLDIGLVAGEEVLAETVENIKENLRESLKSLGFTPSVVGLGIDDVRHLDRDRDP